MFFNHLYDPISLVRDNEVKEAMAGIGVACQSFNSDLLYEPWDILSGNGQPLTCFADYWSRCALLRAQSAGFNVERRDARLPS